MQNQPIFKRKQLVIAVSMAMLGGALTGCSSSSDSPAPAGTATITANGGMAGKTLSATGGDGGPLSLYNEGGSGGVEIRTTGVANTNFTTPGQITADAAKVDLGDNPLEVIADLILQVVDMNSGNGYADTTGNFDIGELYLGDDDMIRASAAGGVAVFADDAMLAAGTYYLRNYWQNSPRIYLAADGAISGHSVVTGLSVAEGATLTLGNNNGTNNVRVSFTNDIDNSGTITKEITSDYGSLNLYPHNYIASGAVVNAGTEDYESAGTVSIYADNGISNSGPINVSGFDEDNDVDGEGVVIGNENGGNGGEIYLDAGGYVLNSGMLDNSGGDGRGSGGYGGSINMYGAYVENTGDLDNSGGNNVSDPMVAGSGGYGGYIYMRADYVANNTAAIDNSGGDGSSGGYGGNISIRNQEVGEVKNAGNLNMNGGAGTDSSGGRGGYLSMDANGGSALSSGDISAVGGNTTEGVSSGGDGGELMFMADGGELSNAAPGDVVVSGNLAVSGGNATADGSGDGGDAGSIALDLYMNDKVASQRVALLGYASIDANGGDGADGGEGAGAWASGIALYADHYETDDSTIFAGSAVNNLPVNARGGNSTATDPDTGDGGWGGEVSIMASTWEAVKSLNVTATNTADIDVSGGNAVGDETSSTQGGYGGEFSLAAYHGANNSGAINGNGGNGGIDGAYGGEATIHSVAGAAVNSGAMTFNGSDGGQDGYSGGNVYVFGASATNSADIGVNGGNATETDELVMSNGGSGGDVVISGIGLSAPSTNTGNVSYSGGTGDTDGEEGCLQVGITFEGNCN